MLGKLLKFDLKYGMKIFGEKWHSRIICVLSALTTLRYSELRKERNGNRHSNRKRY